MEVMRKYVGNTDISSDLVNVHQFSLIYFSDADVMFGCDDKAALKPSKG